MANAATATPVLTFPRETFAKLTPAPYLEAHLKQSKPVRPNGRLCDEFRDITVNAGSLTHSNGSAVVRCGDTAIVCGIRAEILLASDIPNPPSEDIDDHDLVEELGLLVPNVELSTGCSPAHLPGNPPSTVAQSLSYRILSLLHTANIINPADLLIKYTELSTDSDIPDEAPKEVTKAYWTLYIDILCIALDGNAFDTMWAATMAAFQDTVLPKAWWDQDQETILCSPRFAEASRLRIRDMPATSSFVVFSTASPLKQPARAEHWVLADPDSAEEDVCRETLSVTVASKTARGGGLLRVEKSGGPAIDAELMAKCIGLAEERRKRLLEVLQTT